MKLLLSGFALVCYIVSAILFMKGLSKPSVANMMIPVIVFAIAKLLLILRREYDI